VTMELAPSPATPPERPGRRPFVARPGPLRHFLIGQTTGQAADAIAGAVLLTVLLGSDGQVDASRLLPTMAAAALPYAVIGPVAGVISDHWPRRPSFVGVGAARLGCALLALCAVTTDARWLAYVAAAGLISSARVGYLLRAASLPAVAERAQLVRADAASLYLGSAMALVAGGAGAAGSAVAELTLAAAAALAVASMIAFATLRVDLGGHGFGQPLRLAEVASAVSRLLVGRVSRWAIAVTAGHRVLLGALFATTVLAMSTWVGGAGGYLAAAGLTGASTFAGTCSAASIAARTGRRRLVALAFGVPAVALGIAVLTDPIVVGLPAVAATFFVFQSLRVVADSVVQDCMPDAARGRVFAAYDIAYNLSYFGGAAVALTLSRTLDPFSLIALVAMAYLVASLAIVARRRVIVTTPVTVRA
jgi:hypothetical protein